VAEYDSPVFIEAILFGRGNYYICRMLQRQVVGHGRNQDRLLESGVAQFLIGQDRNRSKFFWLTCLICIFYGKVYRRISNPVNAAVFDLYAKDSDFVKCIAEIHLPLQQEAVRLCSLRAERLFDLAALFLKGFGIAVGRTINRRTHRTIFGELALLRFPYRWSHRCHVSSRLS